MDQHRVAPNDAAAPGCTQCPVVPVPVCELDLSVGLCDRVGEIGGDASAVTAGLANARRDCRPCAIGHVASTLRQIVSDIGCPIELVPSAFSQIAGASDDVAPQPGTVPRRKQQAEGDADSGP
jgi:hypothetical protein